MYRFGFLYYSIYEIDTSVILSKLRQNMEKKSFLQLGQDFRKKKTQIESLYSLATLKQLLLLEDVLLAVLNQMLLSLVLYNAHAIYFYDFLLYIAPL